MKISLVGCALALLALISCATTTTELPMTQNIVRLYTNASGGIMQRAAEATITRGYTHFRLEQVETSSGSRFVGMNTNTNTYGSMNASVYRNTAYGSYNANSFNSPVSHPTVQIGVTIIMFKADEPGAEGAFDAAEVLKKKGNV